jgi:hypothetical protein
VEPGSQAGMSTTDGVIAVVLVLFELALVFMLFRTLALHPAPAVGRMSLRRAAGKWLVAGLPRRQRLAPSDRTRHRALKARGLLYLAAPLLILLPIEVRVGPLDDATKSTDYLQTMWQVVAAALGVSVAMVAFAFEAYTSTAQNRHGGSLRDFAAETRLQVVIRLGALSLLVDGAVLFGAGHDAPGGWAGGWAILLSAVTLASVPWVVTNIVSSLDPSRLSAMRARRLGATVAAAMREQLIGQAAEVVLANLGRGFPASRVFLANPGQHTVAVARPGDVTDVRLGPLARMIVRRRTRGIELNLQLHVELGEHVAAGKHAISSAVSLSARLRRSIRRCVRIGRRDDRRPDRLLVAQLNLLHRQAITAVRDRRTDDWREVSNLYELVLLALPKETARLGIPFAGAIARPGLFGFGPVQRIADFLLDELQAAVEANSTELVDAITYFPQHIAREAVDLGAVAVGNDMLALYPRMYGLWIRGSA